MDEENNQESQVNEDPSPSDSETKLSPMIIAAVVAVLALLVGMYFISKNKSADTQSVESTTEQSTEQVTQSEASPASQSVDAESETAGTQTISVEGGGFYFKPNQIKVKKGDKVTLEFKSVGGQHDFVIDELDVKTPLTTNGSTSKVEFTPETAGTFKFYCSVGNHRAMGMEGTIVVVE